ncbi:MAG: RagB/SusD family nutrient uptake outer membrane protein [Tannerellaceae bacterium]|nr:RagB/SusD family nutrient uptake outer membrane protein [Tannerellaceae bacterium]
MRNFYYKLLSPLFFLYIFSGCNLLDEKVYSELTTDTYLTTAEGKLSVLYSAYGNAQFRNYYYFFTSGMCSGETWNEFGAIEADFTPLSNFTWDSNHTFFNEAWVNAYAVIRDANIVLANTDTDGSDEQLRAEAHFLRGFAYWFLHDWYGALPLYTSPDDPLQLPRSSEQETINFIEEELSAAAAVLPVSQEDYGRATKEAALGILTNLYLNTRQWKKVVTTTQQIIDLEKYELIASYSDVFSIENEGNNELLWVIAATPQTGHSIVAITFPTDYPVLSNQTTYAARVYLFDEFVNSFAESDSRKDLIITSYTNTSEEFIQLLGNDRSLSGKYEFDRDALGAEQGNDIPVIRYTDILLSRAEALNELNGPVSEAVELVNAVRLRAGIHSFSPGEFTQESFRDAIFRERTWEFYYEQKSRSDQIRQGTFIKNAQVRNTRAQDFHILFPIPLQELDANPLLEQNAGY